MPLSPAIRGSRRQFLCGAALSAVGALLAACGGSAATPTSAPVVATTATGASTAPVASTGAAPAPTAAAARSTATASASGAATVTRGAAAGSATPASAPLVAPPLTPRTAAPRGELRYAPGTGFPANADATKSGYNMISYGAGETLTRLTSENQIQPWLAESVSSTSETTWRVKLRANARFWDGTAVDATAVAAAFRTNWEVQGGASGLIDKATTIAVVDPTTLDFNLPRPAGNFPYALSAQFFVVHKDAGKTMTGPYKVAKYEADREMALEGFTGHWGGPPPIAKLTVRSVPDANTRALALQSGEIDMIGNVLPETLSTFGPDITTVAVPSTRVHMILLNSTSGPFAEQKLREATAYAIDRGALLKVALSGQGEALTTFFPKSAGFDQVPLQSFDANRARQLLDEAGWVAGADGVRAKAGKRLAFPLLSYPGRPELTQMAVAMQGQLKAFGYDMQLREVPQIDPVLQSGQFEASMYSSNSLITGDPLYFYNLTLGRASTYNYSKYEMPGVEPLLADLRDEREPAQRQVLSRQIQELVKTYVPNIHLVAPPLIFAHRKDFVRDFTVNPNDLYLFDTTVRVG